MEIITNRQNRTEMKKMAMTLLGGILLAGCAGQGNSSQEAILGKWNIDKAMGLSTETAETPAFINFTEEGKVNGNSSVNLFNGEYKIEDGKLEFSPLAMTRMMGRSMDVEQAVTEALNTAHSIVADGDKAVVLNEAKDTVMVLSRQK